MQGSRNENAGAGRNLNTKAGINMGVISIVAVYIACINLIGFASMGIDKSRARKKLWRISETTLFLIAIIGGSIGSIIGMHLFKHKTRHWYFLFGMPAILVIQILIVVAFIYSPIQFGIM